jgi:hypothetical protein
MIRYRRYTALMTSATALALAGCTSVPPLRAAWYQASEAKGRSVETGPFVIAVQNYGPDTLEIHGIALNRPGKKDGIHSIADFKGVPDGTPVKLVHKGVLTVELAKDDVPPCTLPVAVYIWSGPRKKFHEIALGGLPTFLTNNLMKCRADAWRAGIATRTKETAESAMQTPVPPN